MSEDLKRLVLRARLLRAARLKVESLSANVRLQGEAYGGLAYRDDIEALTRAREELKSVEALYADGTGLLEPDAGQSTEQWRQ